MRTIILSISLLAIGVITRAQETSAPTLLKNEAAWTVEHFPLPTGFAQDMTVTGTEEAYFPPGWSDIESPELWSYVFVWEINSDALMTESAIERNLEMYFDGLMGIPKDTIIAPKLPTTAVLLKQEAEAAKISYVGKVRTFDRFRSQQMMTLHMELIQRPCTTQGKTYVVIRFSPKPHEHAVWNNLRKLTLQEPICKHN